MRKLTIFVIIAAFLALAAAGLATATSRGELTGPEYQQLIFLRDKLQSADGINSSIFNCNTMPSLPTIHSQLLDRERTDCTAGFLLIRFNGEMKHYVGSCDRKPALDDRLSCLVTPYEQLETLYFTYATAERQVRQLAISRGLPAACVDTLSDPPAVISEETRAADALHSIVIGAESGNYSMFEAASKTLVSAAADVSKGQQANNAPLSVCPHPAQKYSS
jgi:hypothetical protein